MKKIVLLLIFFNSINILAQKMFFEDFVECYYSKDTNESILIYKSPNGEKVGELNQLTDKHCWYKFAISESKNGWLKIENILALPGCGNDEIIDDFEQYNGKWVLAKNMLINVGIDLNVEIDCISNKTNGKKESNGYKFYQEPNLNSKVVFCVSGFVQSELTEIKGTWAKLKITNNGKDYIGWLQRKYQCAYPWTTCPVDE